MSTTCPYPAAFSKSIGLSCSLNTKKSLSAWMDVMMMSLTPFVFVFELFIFPNPLKKLRPWIDKHMTSLVGMAAPEQRINM